MLKTNVITNTYAITLRSPSGGVSVSEVTAESEAAARLKVFVPYGWAIEKVEKC